MPNKDEMKSLTDEFGHTQAKGAFGAIMIACFLIGVSGCLVGIIIGYCLARH